MVVGTPGILAGPGMAQGVQEGSLGNQGWAGHYWLDIPGTAVQGIPEEDILEEGTRERREGGILERWGPALCRGEAARNSSAHCRWGDYLEESNEVIQHV